MKKETLKLLFKPLTIVNKVMPKDKNLVMFYTNLGFRDNVKELFDYMISKGLNKKYKIVLSLNDESEIKKIPNGVIVVDNKEGIKYFLRAKYMFFCFGKYPIKPSDNQVVVNLTHGIPLKKLGNTEKGKENIDYNYFTYVLTCSEYYRQIMKDCFGCFDNQILIGGQPRCDRLFMNLPAVDSKIRKGAKKLFVWMPTYRFTKGEVEEESDTEEVIDESKVTTLAKLSMWPIPMLSREDIKELDSILKQNETKLIIKLHPLQAYNDTDYRNMKLKNIEILTQKELDKRGINVYDLCRASDGLITDYSSIYFDYLLLNKPIGFVVEDMRKYSNDRGFLLDPAKDYMPGMFIKNYDDMLKFMKDVCEGEESFGPDRSRVNHLINTYQDGKNCKRLLEKIGMDSEYPAPQENEN
ncbi:CDP-glycerol glycerophosphotransferase family protein [Eubacterium uniforme]|uniref:CDP-glycerol glycerophosphotransferase, TagB/SpsB family n=1 Tax=Eubacterium uniforme TaxID=39495 RepID=A0A1T4VDY2_9FIRM|nr:CDP-glycerol glycerophosphotransferase family protein [Eubacterium uniforme]SKA63189.1 CDP-glycerol glycerophosphotransferase, TagB/SpsB family [Eubacterium uniforme]HAH19221.1 hypothetical protein [Eubacterium sp.]HAV91175.1 hypothetical protein [Eubacterium sp.]